MKLGRLIANPNSSLLSVRFSHSVMSKSLLPHESQHTRPPCPSPIPGVYSNPCPLSRWRHPAISSSVIPFSSCPQSFEALGSFPMSQLCMRWPKYRSFSFNISPSNEQLGLTSFRMDWLDLLEVQRTLKSLFQHHSSKPSILLYSAFFTIQLSHPYITTGKTIALTRWTFVGKVMSSLLWHSTILLYYDMLIYLNYLLIFFSRQVFQYVSSIMPTLFPLFSTQYYWSIPAFSKWIFKDFGANKLFSIHREWSLISNTTGGLSGKPDYSLHLWGCSSCCVT